MEQKMLQIEKMDILELFWISMVFRGVCGLVICSTIVPLHRLFLQSQIQIHIYLVVFSYDVDKIVNFRINNH